LAEINPSILESLSSTAERMSEAEKIYRNAVEQAIERVKNGNTIDIGALKAEVSPSTILHEILAPYGFNGTQTEEMTTLLDGESGKLFTSKSHTVLKDRNSLIITDARIELMQPTTLSDEGDIYTPFGTLHIEKRDFDGTIPKVHNMACLDADSLVLPLTIRHTQNGDRFAPFGMHGTKLVSDYLTDRKKSLIEKQKQLVVTDATGKIVWVVNERPASPYCIKKDTGRIICLEWRIPGE
jgi:tRNA(Ile)-lysidine synthase